MSEWVGLLVWLAVGVAGFVLGSLAVARQTRDSARPQRPTVLTLSSGAVAQSAAGEQEPLAS